MIGMRVKRRLAPPPMPAVSWLCVRAQRVRATWCSQYTSGSKCSSTHCCHIGDRAACCHILPHPLPPEVHQGGQGRQLLADLGHGRRVGRATDGAARTLRWRRSAACNWLSTSADVWGVESADTERMQRERERLQVVPIRAVYALPSASPPLASPPPTAWACWASCTAWRRLLASCQGLLGFLEGLLRLSQSAGQWPANSSSQGHG